MPASSAVKYKQSPDWSPLAALTDGAALDTAAGAAGLIPTGDGGRDHFSGASIYDALNRVDPDGLASQRDDAAQRDGLWL